MLSRFQSRKSMVLTGFRIVAVGASQTRDDALRLGKRKRFQQRRIDDAEHRRVSSDADSEHADRHCGEARLARQSGHAVAQILHEIFEPTNAALISVALFHWLDAAEAAPRLTAGFVWRQPRRDAVPLGKLEVRSDLVVELLLELASLQQRAHAMDELTQTHEVVSKNRDTNEVVVCHLATSMSSCFLPARLRA